MEQFFGFFWLICGIWIGLFGAAYLKYALGKRVLNREFTAEQVSSFALRYALWTFLPCLAMWLLQRSVGPNAPIEYAKWPDPQRLMAFGLQLFLWAAMLFWTFFKNGAQTLSQYARIASQTTSFFNSPGAIKLLALAIPAAAFLAQWLKFA